MALAHSERDKLFAHCYGLYHAHMRACNVLDFDDLILLLTLLLGRNEEVCERCQNRTRYLLVDEYQDTNTSQYELVKLLVGNRARFTVVCDDDQSIYSWRGARPQNLALLKKNFPALRVFKLEQNYRSSERILKAANILIANNPHGFEKPLFSTLGYGEELKVITAINEDHEAERVIGELIAHHFVKKPLRRLRDPLSRQPPVTAVRKDADAEPHPLQDFRRYLVLFAARDQGSAGLSTGVNQPGR